jgi:hypothetical protein
MSWEAPCGITTVQYNLVSVGEACGLRMSVNIAESDVSRRHIEEK